MDKFTCSCEGNFDKTAKALPLPHHNLTVFLQGFSSQKDCFFLVTFFFFFN